jgi:hypothetical protein
MIEQEEVKHEKQVNSDSSTGCGTGGGGRNIFLPEQYAKYI